MRLTKAHFSAAILIGVIAVTGMAAPAPKEDSKAADKGGTNPEKIRAALDRTGNFEFQGNTTLGSVINSLGEQYKIPIVLDKAALAQMGFDADGLNVQANLKDVKLRTALRTIVGEYNLTIAILSDCLLITTEEMAVYRQLKQRVSMDCEDVPLTKVLKDIATKYGVNIVVDPKAIKSKAVESKVSLQVDDVPVEAAVRLLCEMADLKPARMGNVILVTTETRADKLKDSNSLVPAPVAPGMPGGGTFPFPVPGIGGAGVQQAVPPAIAVDSPAVAPPVVPPAIPPANPPEKKE